VRTTHFCNNLDQVRSKFKDNFWEHQNQRAKTGYPKFIYCFNQRRRHQDLQEKLCSAEQDCFGAPGIGWDFTKNWGKLKSVVNFHKCCISCASECPDNTCNEIYKAVTNFIQSSDIIQRSEFYKPPASITVKRFRLSLSQHFQRYWDNLGKIVVNAVLYENPSFIIVSAERFN
jgi:hypothetical protein